MTFAVYLDCSNVFLLTYIIVLNVITDVSEEATK